jgi:hypothetical protein
MSSAVATLLEQKKIEAQKSIAALKKLPIINDWFLHGLIGESQNPVLLEWEKLTKRATPVKIPIKSKGSGNWFQMGVGFVLEVQGSFSRYCSKYVPIYMKMKELSENPAKDTAELRAQYNLCSLEKINVVAEECAIMFKGPHTLYWKESCNKLMHRSVTEVHFWRLYHDAHEFLRTGCTPVAVASEVQDAEMSDALVLSTASLSLSSP